MKPVIKTLRWGLLSTAKINRMLIPSLKHSRRNSLVAVASRSIEKANEYARKWNIQRTFGTYESLLEDDIDVVYIGLPNHLHAEWTIKALEAGKHVLCEKPLALTADEVDAIIETSERTGKIVTEAFMYRHHLQTKKVNDLVQSGAIGEIQFARGSFSFYLDEPGNIRWKKEYGGGSLWDVGCYPVSFFRMLAGTAPDEVSGFQILSPDGVDKSFFGQLSYANGMIAQFDSSFCLPSNTRIEIRGTEGTIILADPFRIIKKSAILLCRQNKEKTINVPAQDLYLGEIEDIYEAIINNSPPCISLNESKDNISTIQKLYQCASTIGTVHP